MQIANQKNKRALLTRLYYYIYYIFSPWLLCSQIEGKRDWMNQSQEGRKQNSVDSMWLRFSHELIRPVFRFGAHHQSTSFLPLFRLYRVCVSLGMRARAKSKSLFSFPRPVPVVGAFQRIRWWHFFFTSLGSACFQTCSGWVSCFAMITQSSTMKTSESPRMNVK